MRWRRRNRAEDLERELRDHLEQETEEQHEAGRSADEARYAARRAFGNSTLTKEDVRAVWTWTLLEQIGQDLRYAARTMRKSRGFSCESAARKADARRRVNRQADHGERVKLC